MSEQAEFLKSIATTPDDNTPRLAYADWLDEHDNPHHAALIRQQCGLFQLKDRPVRMVGDALGAAGREVMSWWGTDSDGTTKKYLRLTAVARKNRDVIVKPAHCINRYDRAGTYLGPEEYNWVLFRRGFVSVIYCPPSAWGKYGAAISHDHPGVAWTTNTLLQYADNTYLRAGSHLPVG